MAIISIKTTMLAVVLTALCSTVAQAGSWIDEVRGGIASQSCCGPAQDKEQGIAFNGEVLFKPVVSTREFGVLRPALGGYVATDSDATSYAYAGLDWQYDLPKSFFLGAGAALAVHNGEVDTFDPVIDASRRTNTQFFGCRAQVKISADLGMRLSERLSVMLSWAHMSNANLCTDNEGLDHLGVRLGWTF